MSGSLKVNIDLGSFPTEYSDALLQLAAAKTRNLAKRFVRFKTHNLQNSIRADRVSDEEYVVSSDVEYALAQEYGRPDLPNYGFTPYMRPAAQEVKRLLPELAKQAERSAIQRAKR